VDTGYGVVVRAILQEIAGESSCCARNVEARVYSDKDALHIYQKDFVALGMSNERAGVNVLRHLYALMLARHA